MDEIGQTQARAQLSGDEVLSDRARQVKMNACFSDARIRAILILGRQLRIGGNGR